MCTLFGAVMVVGVPHCYCRSVFLVIYSGLPILIARFRSLPIFPLRSRLGEASRPVGLHKGSHDLRGRSEFHSLHKVLTFIPLTHFRSSDINPATCTCSEETDRRPFHDHGEQSAGPVRAHSGGSLGSLGWSLCLPQPYVCCRTTISLPPIYALSRQCTNIM